ncbi:hypothetical protein EV663_11667 [Rhodovulum bhavnagarense]|uniref:Uncharacterized protein n=1 Tax=Rhodovulum bhavnagarense TaxID=992286 RepID=A0A4R2RJC2_9RHOB|nr:hypothetical protein [Rhodovulum bhavnagarense]TCP59771.1 hypothetical protein EV663_11667 [Rhodovulum bhavnagarense]
MRVCAADWDFEETEYRTGENGQDYPVTIPYKTVTCARCGNAITVFGHSQESFEAACVQLRLTCPKGENNFYLAP